VYAGLESQLTDTAADRRGRALRAVQRLREYDQWQTRRTLTEIVPNVAVRAAVSTGFRAPSLQQLWFNNISTQFVFVGGVLTPQNVLTSNNQSRVTKAVRESRLSRRRPR